MDKQTELESDLATDVISENSKPLLDKIFNQEIKSTPEKNSNSYPNSLIGSISTFEPSGYAVVEFTIDDTIYTFEANTTVELNLDHIGGQCLIVFNQGNIEQPIITGIIQQPLSIEELMDEDKPVVIHSKTGILLKCGSSRIELTEDGTINIQGMHINSQAYGPHRIKGGSVKIN